MNKDANLEKKFENLLTMNSELAKINEDLQKNISALVAKDNDFMKNISTLMDKNSNLESDMVNLLCYSYKVLNNPKRKSTHKSIWEENTCDKVGKRNTSPDWKGKNWYRFVEPSGTKMPEEPIPTHR